MILQCVHIPGVLVNYTVTDRVQCTVHFEIRKGFLQPHMSQAEWARPVCLGRIYVPMQSARGSYSKLCVVFLSDGSNGRKGNARLARIICKMTT
jgi:hypothetical protein